jgi:hypothetical protein
MAPRLVPLVAALLVVAGIGILRWVPIGHAQTDQTARNTLVAAWRVTLDQTDPDHTRTLVVFTADGTYQQFDPDGTVSVGSWSALSPHTAALTVISYRADRDGNLTGAQTLRGLAETNDGGEGIIMLYTIQAIDAAGTEAAEHGPFTAMGTRIDVELVPKKVATLTTP